MAFRGRYLTIIKQPIEYRAVSFTSNPNIEPPELCQKLGFVVWRDILQKIHIVCVAPRFGIQSLAMLSQKQALL